MRVLLVDDDVDTVDMVGMLLRSAGHDVQVAYGGTEALEACDAHAPEIAITDINMPGMSGQQLAAALRKKRGKQIQLVSLTGRFDRGVAFAGAFDHHLGKPVTAQQLFQVIAAAQATLSRLRA